jgi:RNA-directed DNA polymerase
VVGRSGKVCGHNPDVYGAEKSDTGIVPVKAPNNIGGPIAEVLEGRPVTKGNSGKVVCDLYTGTGGNIERA